MGPVGCSYRMTAITDNKRRVVLRQAKPGDRFDVAFLPDEGKYVLTRPEPVKPRPRKVRLVRKQGYLVAVSAQPITEEQTRKLLDEFP